MTTEARMNEHWLCPECDVFDGPISDGNCDVCLHDGNLDQRVVRLVPVPDEQAIERAAKAVPGYVIAGIVDDWQDVAREEVARAVLAAALEQPE
jgi:hypothetical protein